MNSQELKVRTKAFALRVIKMSTAMPRTIAADVLSKQVVRSATSVAANYRAACRARSHRDFLAKLGVVEEEADETLLWLELITEAGLLSPRKTAALRAEANELTAIIVASIRTAREHGKNPQSAVPNPQSR